MAFAEELAARNPPPESREWVYVPYDQLTDQAGPLAERRPSETGIVLVECPGKARRRPYHKQKLALILANQRKFALEQAQRGVAVRYRVAKKTYAEALADLAPLVAMRPAERELREELKGLVDDGRLTYVDHAGWLTTTDQFEDACGEPPWRMDSFYRRVRRDTGILMDGAGEPEGGRFSFDTENRKPWKGEPPAAEPPTFRANDIKREVKELVEREFADHPGRVDLAALPASAHEAERLWDWAKDECLPTFGPYEDAMSRASTTLFHTRVSALLHLHRLLPRRVVDDVAGMDAPLASREGFVRQVLGWREFMRHVHEATDGFRRIAQPGFLGEGHPLPPAFWGDAPSGLACLDTVVDAVWEEGYGHHITRLMILSNLATLLDVSPRELTDWFWVAYTDAYDWVVEPNVLGMGTYATGPLMTTKPYVSGANYIARMSDYCEACAFDPKRSCPITRLYWAFLARHERKLGDNPRLRMPYVSLGKRSPAEKGKDTKTFRRVREALENGERLDLSGS